MTSGTRALAAGAGETESASCMTLCLPEPDYPRKDKVAPLPPDSTGESLFDLSLTPERQDITIGA